MLIGIEKITDLCIDFIENNISDNIESVEISTDFTAILTQKKFISAFLLLQPLLMTSQQIFKLVQKLTIFQFLHGLSCMKLGIV